MTKNPEGKSSYRYVILIVYMLVSAAIQIQWLTHAAVVRPAAVFYADQYNPDSFFNLDLLAISFMFVFLIMSFPASYIIDTYGIRKALIGGSILLGLFSVSKAAFADSFSGVLLSQIGLAFAQPFIINAVTALTSRWFPIKERALAAGLATLAQFVGIIIAMIVTPILVGSDPTLATYGTGFETMLWCYAGFSCIASLSLIIFIKEKPTNINSAHAERFEFLTGLKHIISQRDMLIATLLFLVGLGIMNAISSMTDAIAAQLGVQDSDGLIGGAMLIGGIIGSLILPALSDQLMKRKLFLVICMLGMIPGVMGMAFANTLGSSAESIYNIALAASFVLGFFVMSAGPIGFQYAAEICHPAPESTSQGILLWIGQVSGIVFVTVMSISQNLYLQPMMLLFSVLAIAAFILVLFIRESDIQTAT